jgi:hypothetical protein
MLGLGYGAVVGVEEAGGVGEAATAETAGADEPFGDAVAAGVTGGAGAGS